MLAPPSACATSTANNMGIFGVHEVKVRMSESSTALAIPTQEVLGLIQTRTHRFQHQVLLQPGPTQFTMRSVHNIVEPQTCNRTIIMLERAQTVHAVKNSHLPVSRTFSHLHVVKDVLLELDKLRVPGRQRGRTGLSPRSKPYELLSNLHRGRYSQWS